ncbi:tetraspanin-9 [Eurytemora carolleeae]|uniref:tetraspanin-9 n=1 Tax=Eurytemora carolleeae TaxID=1294199 RepID=UPI000C76442D|nr:tetraspanin-9 [Eurytemora carolleeae]|eukprot:XP_023347949.1 tetraspanin-9-like [Eurytemora affinis]
MGRNIEYNLQESNPSAIYFTIIIILLVLLSFFSLFTCLGCCGTACKSSCMIGSFIVIEFVLFGGSVGGLVFLHYKYGLDAVQEILDQELSRSVSSYSQDSVLIKGAWDWFLVTAQCCGVGVEGIKVWSRADLKPNYRVPQACCKPNYDECMYEPGFETTNLSDCIPILLPFSQALIYGLPVLMLIS